MAQNEKAGFVYNGEGGKVAGVLTGGFEDKL